MPRFGTNDLVFDPATRRTMMVRVLETSFDQHPPVTIYGCREYLCAGSLGIDMDWFAENELEESK